jgi:hypothetical protein
VVILIDSPANGISDMSGQAATAGVYFYPENATVSTRHQSETAIGIDRELLL